MRYDDVSVKNMEPPEKSPHKNMETLKKSHIIQWESLISNMFEKSQCWWKNMTKRLVDISFVLKFDLLKSYLCKASELREIWNVFQPSPLR